MNSNIAVTRKWTLLAVDRFFFADLSRAASKRRLQDRYLPEDAWRLIMREHAGRYDALPRRSKMVLEARACLLAAEKKQGVIDLRAALLAELRLARARMGKNRPTTSKTFPNHSRLQ